MQSRAQFVQRAERLSVAELMAQGAITGLFISQSVAWQDLIASGLEHVFKVAPSEPLFALWRAMLVTLFTTTAAWGILFVMRRCQ